MQTYLLMRKRKVSKEKLESFVLIHCQILPLILELILGGTTYLDHIRC